MWLPYLIVPMKTRRQTGFLFPTISFSDQNGTQLVLPFFWATSQSTDLTIGIGEYSARGRRLELEGRYALSERSGGKANYYYLRDDSANITGRSWSAGSGMNRWAVDIQQVQELPWHIEEKLRLTDVSDNEYPIFIGDVPGRYEPVIASDVMLSHASSDLSAYVAARRLRNLLNTSSAPGTDEAAVNEATRKRFQEFDPRTVQLAPAAVVTTNDRFILGSPVAVGLTVGVANFTRSSSAFDFDASRVPFGVDPSTVLGPNPTPIPGVDPIRKATRVSVVPTLYTTVRPFDAFSVIPSFRYNSYFYSFHNEMDNLYRGYLQFQTDLSTQLERIYDTEDKNIPRVKHLIRPVLTYSYIPFVREPDHPFLKQIRQHEGYNFDNYDIVPLGSEPVAGKINYFVPQGNSLTYGLTTQLIRRRGAEEALMPYYERSVEFTATQGINFRNHQNPLTRFGSTLGLSFDRFSSTTEYTYTPYIVGSPHYFTTTAGYIFERALHDKILLFDRSVSVSYGYVPPSTSNVTATVNYSLSDFVLPSFSTSFNQVEHKFISNALNVQFQSPSRCWRFSVGIVRAADQGLSHPWDFSLNLTGTGFGGLTEYAAQAGVLKGPVP